MVEYTDELIGSILKATPKNYVVALVSDHGFERVDKILNVPVLLKQKGVEGEVRVAGGFAYTKSAPAASVLRTIGREVPENEVRQYAPELAGSLLFEPPEHIEFGNGTDELYSKPREIGNHGFWPARKDYRSVFVLWGAGVKPMRLGEIQ